MTITPCDTPRCANVPAKPYRCLDCKLTLCKKHADDHANQGHRVLQPKISKTS